MVLALVWEAASSLGMVAPMEWVQCQRRGRGRAFSPFYVADDDGRPSSPPSLITTTTPQFMPRRRLFLPGGFSSRDAALRPARSLLFGLGLLLCDMAWRERCVFLSFMIQNQSLSLSLDLDPAHPGLGFSPLRSVKTHILGRRRGQNPFIYPLGAAGRGPCFGTVPVRTGRSLQVQIRTKRRTSSPCQRIINL
jgi:hypothetical protein